MAEQGHDLYRVLGVSRDASADEIRAAYRHISRSAHPDAGGSEARFRAVREAYEVLSDPVARAAYDGPPPRAAPPTPRREAPPPAPEPATSPVGCVLGIVVVVGVAIVIGVAIVAAVGTSNAPTANQRGADRTTAAPATRVDNFAQWRAENAGTVAAVVENGQELGVALSGAIDIDALREICTRRRLLLDALESSGPAPRDDITKAINGFVASERRAMSSCLASPPDFDRLAEWGERGRADLQTIARATQSG